MTKDVGLTDVTMLIDRSGSMTSMRAKAIEGFNSFVEEQRKLPGGARMTLIFFDSDVEVAYEGVDVREVALLTPETYMPSGNTSLRDALVSAIARTEKRIARTTVPVVGEDAMAKLAVNAIFIAITDGEDTSSREVSRSAVRDTVDAAKKRGWEFLFIGANIDAISTGETLGVQGMAFQQGNMQGALAAASAYVGSSRMEKNAALSPAIRSRAKHSMDAVFSARSVESTAMHVAADEYSSLVSELAAGTGVSPAEVDQIVQTLTTNGKP